MSGKKHSLLLINPRWDQQNQWNLREVAAIVGKKKSVMPLSLPTLAALTPDTWDIHIVDEDVEPISFDAKPDVVGITSMVVTSRRANEIADMFRSRGVPVVIGGAFSTFSSELVAPHADAVFVGESETTWAPALNDFVTTGTFKPVYKADAYCEFKRMPMPRWDLIKVDKYMSVAVQVSRGCPYQCDFCCIHKMFGGKQRYRDLDNVIDEIKRLPIRQISFVDDNLTMNKRYARELMAALKPLKVAWNCSVSIDVAFDDELLEAMAEAGCSNTLIGIESLNPESISEMKKGQNKIERYDEAIRRVQSKGIHVLAAMIVGFDHDTPETLARIEEFGRRNNMPFVMLSILTPLPNTDLYARLAEQKRLQPVDPDVMTAPYPCLQFMHFSHSQIFRMFFETVVRMYSWENLYHTSVGLFSQGFFRRVNPAVPLWAKIRGSAVILRHYLFSKDPWQRKLFYKMVHMGTREKKADMSTIAEYLLFLAGLTDYVKTVEPFRRETLAKLTANDVPALAGSGSAR